MMKYVYLGISFLCIVTMSFCGYYFLGGFEKVEVVEIGESKFSIVGRPFKGNYHKSDSLNDLQREVADFIRNQRFNGDFAEVSYTNTPISEDEVDLFLGVLFYDQEILVPVGYSVREYTADNFLVVKLTMHPLVMPSSQEVQAIMYSYARENRLELEDQFLAITFDDDNSMEVYAPLKSVM